MRHCVCVAQAAFLCFAIGCGSSSETHDAPAVKGAPPKKVKQADEGAPAVPLVDMFSYSAVGKRDPFRSYLSELAEQNSEHHFARKLEETEYFELDQYHLTGLITGISQPKAMVEDPDGRGHVVQIGSRIGKNAGLVSQVSPTGILIIEETHDSMGKKINLPVMLKLPQTSFEDIAKR